MQLFSTVAQNNSKLHPQSQIIAKRQNFHNQIRRKKINEYKVKARTKLLYDRPLNYDILHKINLKENMDLITKYQFPQIDLKNADLDIDACQRKFDLELQENKAIKNAIEGVFLYVTSSMSDHALNFLQQSHIMRIAEILDRKVQSMRPQSRNRNIHQMRKCELLVLPKIYEKALVILTHWSFDDNIYFQEAYEYLIDVFNELIQMFPRQTKVIECCIYCLASCFMKEQVAENIINRLNNNKESSSILTQIVLVFEYEINNYNSQSYHSSRVISSILNFFAKLFMHIEIFQIYPLMRTRIYKCFRDLLSKDQRTDEITKEIVVALLQLYDSNDCSLPEVVLQTQDLLQVIADQLYKGVLSFFKKKVKQMMQLKLQILIYCFQIFKSIFNNMELGKNEEIFIEACEFLGYLIDEKMDLIMQKGLKVTERPILTHSMQLIESICLWEDFFPKVYQNSNIMIRLFYFCNDQNMVMRKNAISCIRNIIEGYFTGKNYNCIQQYQVYQNVFERFQFLDVLVENLDKYSDLELNKHILNIIRILSMFWQCEPELERQNRFWLNFVQKGGELKLNAIIVEDRNQEMQEIVNQILDLFKTKDIEI